MFDIYLRQAKDLLIEPISKLFLVLQHTGLTPNHITLLSGLFGLPSVFGPAALPERTRQAFRYHVPNTHLGGEDGA